MTIPQHSMYLSHSWLPEHVDVNVAIWNRIWDTVLLIVDADDDADDPPYYVHRIEHRIRTSDLLLAVLVAPRGVDAKSYEGSPYQLFEIALGSRAGLPMLVLHEADMPFGSSLFRTESFTSMTFDPTDLTTLGVISPWLNEVTESVQPRTPKATKRVGLLLPNAPHSAAVQAALQHITQIHDLHAVVLTDTKADNEVMAILRTLDVLIADIGAESCWDTYGMAHAMMIPTIRLLHGSPPASTEDLPRILRGHRAGYQEDLVSWTNSEQLEEALTPRITCLYSSPLVADNLEEGRTYFAQRR